MIEDKKQRAVSRGKRALLLMQDELLNEGFDVLQANYTQALFATHPIDTVQREKLYMAFNMIGKVKEHLQRVLNDGKLAQTEIDQLTKPPSHLRAV